MNYFNIEFIIIVTFLTEVIKHFVPVVREKISSKGTAIAVGLIAAVITWAVRGELNVYQLVSSFALSVAIYDYIVKAVVKWIKWLFS